MEPRIALLGFSIECNRFAPLATEADFSARTLLSGQAMLDEARSSGPAHAGRTPRLRRRHGCRRPVAAGAHRARHGRAQRPGGPGILRPPDGAVGSRPARRGKARRRLLRAAWRRPGDPGPRSRRHLARAGPPRRRRRRPRGRHLRPARQRIGRRRRAGERVHRLPHQSASRHARTRRRGRAHAAPPAVRHAHLPRPHPAADRAADRHPAYRQGRAEPALWRADRPRPAAHGRTAVCWAAC